jgi:hypothetical protein
MEVGGCQLFCNLAFLGFFCTIMPLSVSFQKMDPYLDAIIISAEVVSVGANNIGACLSDVEAQMVVMCQGVGAIDLGADPWRRQNTCQGVGAIDLGADPLYPMPVILHPHFFTPHRRRNAVSPRRPVHRPTPPPRPPRAHGPPPTGDTPPHPGARSSPASSSSNPDPDRLGKFLIILVIVLAFFVKYVRFFCYN